MPWRPLAKRVRIRSNRKGELRQRRAATAQGQPVKAESRVAVARKRAPSKLDRIVEEFIESPTFPKSGHGMFFGKHQDDDDTVVAMLASALRRDISFSVLAPDQKLKIERLRQRYGGSNHSMRETLRLLSAEGLVEATSQRGFRVTSATEADRQDILFLRLQIEKLGLSRSMARSDIAWEGRVMAAFHAETRTDIAIQQSPDDLTALEWDKACRTSTLAVMSASGSSRLIDLAEKFFNQASRFRLALLREGRVNFNRRKTRREELREAILTRHEQRAFDILEATIIDDMGA